MSLVSEICRIAQHQMVPVKVADARSREEIAYRNQYREFNKQQAVENPRWVCPGCGVMNFARTHNYGNGHIITPRAYCCHNSKCGGRRFYWRNERNELFARMLDSGGVDELEFVSVHDPVKFYEGIKKLPTRLFE